MRSIPFSPPDISEAEINQVVEVLKSGWITTGPKTKQFEKEIAAYCGNSSQKAVCLNSATASMELVLRYFGIGEGDEVITSAYTYTASASVIAHVGAKIVLVDTKKDSFEMDYDKLADAITEKTKAVIAVDLLGVMCEYDKIFRAVNEKKHLFKSENDRQKALGRVLVLADAAHSFGATYCGKRSGAVADFTAFSFHAVKNLTTAEGGAITWNSIPGLSDEEIYKAFMLLSLHGQSKDAFSKMALSSWEYDIVIPAYKCNMTDITAAIGLAQLARYDGLLKKRKEMIARYNEGLKDCDIQVLAHESENRSSNGHLYPIRLTGKDMAYRNQFIVKMAEQGVSCNVHFKPLPLLTAYNKLGLSIDDYPNAKAQYENEVTLPLNTKMTMEDIDYVVEAVKNILRES